MQMRLNLPANSNIPAPTINGEPIAVVNDFKYLGSYMSSSEKDVNNRITLAWAAFHKLKVILTSKTGKPSDKIKMRLFDTACVSILLYGCETWTLTAQQAKKLNVYARTCYRIILGIVQSESHTTNK
jgi:hypothetical protein